VVLARAAALAALVQDGVLVGGRRVRRVRKRREGLVELGLHAVELVAQRLGAARNLLHVCDRRGGVAARLLGGRDRLRRGVLLRLEPLYLGQQLAPPPVELERAVETRVGSVAPAR
jgi:hypothetical protein